jgi:hypothetical protein
MEQSVSIVLQSGERIDIHLAAADREGLDPKAARRLIAERYEAAGIEAETPTGKILLVDQILLLAQEHSASHWQQPDATLRRLLAAALCALGRDVLTIDLKERRL